jgi:hypothetical protein
LHLHGKLVDLLHLTLYNTLVALNNSEETGRISFQTTVLPLHRTFPSTYFRDVQPLLALPHIASELHLTDANKATPALLLLIPALTTLPPPSAV